MAESDIRAAWLTRLFSTDPADRRQAESAVRRLYTAAGFDEPRHFLWFESPFAASWAVALLVAPHHFVWSQKLSSSALTRGDRARLDEARAHLIDRIGAADWSQVSKELGGPLGSKLQFPPVPARMFQPRLFEARYGLSADIPAMIARHTQEDTLQRAEQRFWGSSLGALPSALHCPTTDMLIGDSFVEDYSFSMMAHDEQQVGPAEPPPIMKAAWDVARSSGMWWPFERAAIMSERPAEIRLNDEKLLHNGDGPAAVFRDGWRVYAWNGKAIPQRWITEPAAVPAREFKGFDPSFAKFIATRVAATAPKPGSQAKPSKLWKARLPDDPVARLDYLRSFAGGKLPLFDRYRAGEYRQVWAALVSLGPAVRDEPHAADALAVAYETMGRVESNVHTVAGRLRAMRYAFTSAPHVTPRADVRGRIAAFEKESGPLPLSLRVFYEVVGEVNLIGRHPALSPRHGDVAPDPLVVYAFDEGAIEFDDEEETAAAITIAPDDLHKADTSGGDPYEMVVPDPRADGELVNERHQLMFVEYLRLCFRYGGFPGYDGVARVPPEIDTLTHGLLDF